jgi:2-C-methyl-D-erythritol 2,4-cyclodiphosphate synthase
MVSSCAKIVVAILAAATQSVVASRKHHRVNTKLIHEGQAVAAGSGDDAAYMSEHSSLDDTSSYSSGFVPFLRQTLGQTVAPVVAEKLKKVPPMMSEKLASAAQNRSSEAASSDGATDIPKFPEESEESPKKYSHSEWTEEPSIRIGHGFVIQRILPKGHPEVTGHIAIGGVIFDNLNFGIVAPSDGDVIYHSIVDAVFGALGLPDIGQFFPDSDPRWKYAPSHVFLKEAWQQMDRRGYRIGNVDVTLITQTPRLMDEDHPMAELGKPYDHKLAMVDNVAALLRCPPNRINVKARAHEEVDAVGEKRALSCHVVTVLEHIG